MNRNSNNKSKLKISLLDGLEDYQKDMIQAIYDKITSGQRVLKRDLKIDFTAMRSKEIEEITKLSRRQLNELAGSQSNIKNPDGSYNLLEIFLYFRSGNGVVDPRAEKLQVETEILREKLADIQKKYMLKTEVETLFTDRTQRLLTALKSMTTNQNLLQLENKSVDELRSVLDNLITDAVRIYRGNHEQQQ